MDAHRLAEERSIAFHAEVARRLTCDPALLGAARERVADWLANGGVHPSYARRWAEILARPLPDVCAALVDPGESARALRQCTPFAGFVPPRTRWRIWREVRRRMEADR